MKAFIRLAILSILAVVVFEAAYTHLEAKQVKPATTTQR